MANKAVITAESGLVVLSGLLGDIGAGKSSFINFAAGESIAKVSESLSPCTTKVASFPIPSKNRAVQMLLVDTPGFNDYDKSDGDILKEIVDWLGTSCHQNARFGGIVYLHDLAPRRQELDPVLGMGPAKLFCSELFGCVTFATVQGREITSSQEASAREDQLKKLPAWKKAAGGRDTVPRFAFSSESAWGILNDILDRNSKGIEVKVAQDELQKLWETIRNKPKSPDSGVLSAFLRMFRRQKA